MAITTLAGALALGALGCSGSITGRGGGDGSEASGGASRADRAGGSSGRSSGGAGAAGTGMGPVMTDPDLDPSYAMPLRRLSRQEFVATVRDLFGDPTLDAPDYPADSIGASGFVAAGSSFTLPDAENVSDATAAIAQKAVTKLATLLPCKPETTGEDACARQLVTKLGRRMYRRPLAPDEVDDLAAFYANARKSFGLDFAGGIELTLETMMQSPFFLYHWELGPTAPSRSGDAIALTSYERAARLSYFLTGSMPDDALAAAADADELRDAAAVTKHARRLLAAPRARDVVRSFFTQWLNLPTLSERTKDPMVKSFTSSLLPALMNETQTFATTVTLDGDGKLATLLTAPYSYVNAELGKLYGASGVTGTQLQKATLPSGQRAGVLTQGSFLALGSGPIINSPVRLGKAIRERFLCDTVAPPPGDVPPAPADPTRTAREQFDEHTKQPTCAGCHKVMDPIGWGFEHYDVVGGYRDQVAGKPVDATGKLQNLATGEERAFNGAVELAALLASSDQVRTCMARQWLRFALARHETGGDAPALMAAMKPFGASDYDLRELVVAVTQTRSFLFRTPADGEVVR